MKIIEQSYEIIDIATDALEQIEKAGRNCYQSEPKGNPAKFVKMLRDKGHHAMLEFADMTVKFTTDRAMLAELTRHRLCSFAVESQRYVKYIDMEFIRPIWFKDDPLDEASHIWISQMRQAENSYLNLLGAGLKPENARAVLPNSTKTVIILNANFREWMHIFNLRCSKYAHPQMRALMQPLQAEMQTMIPEVFENEN